MRPAARRGPHPTWRLLRLISLVAVACGIRAAFAGDGGYALTVAPSVADLNEEFHVCWAAPAGANRDGDWIGFFRISDPSEWYSSWSYTGAATSGCVDLPATRVGPAEFRYLKNNGYVLVAVSDTVTVHCVVDNHCADSNRCSVDKCVAGVCQNTVPTAMTVSPAHEPAPVRSTVDICWDMPPSLVSSDDWITIVPANAPESAYGNFFYTGGAATGCRPIATPPNPGDYEVRLFVQGGDCPVTRSDPFVLCDPLVAAD